MVTVWLQLVHFGEAGGLARQGNGVPSGCVTPEEEPQRLLTTDSRERALTNLGKILIVEVNKDRTTRFKNTLTPGLVVTPLIPVPRRQRQVNSVNSGSARTTYRDPVSNKQLKNRYVA